VVRPVDMTEAQRQPGEQVEGAIRDELVKLIDRYEKPLFNFLTVLLGDRAAAQDCAQDAFLRAYEHLRRDRQVNAAWLYRVARNRAIDELRRRKRIHPDPERIESIAGRDADQLGSPVHDVLEQLSAGDREILYLFDVDGFEAREIGAMLGISRNAVHVRVFRARERFRKIYRPAGAIS
jgi:RNA polymerase sigma factor (sigma-70 family)